MPRRLAALTLVLAVVLAAGCSSEPGSQERFCKALPGTKDLLAVLGSFQDEDTATMEQRFSDGEKQFKRLEKAAPKALHDDVAAVTAVVSEVLDVVQAHPNDPEVIQRELAKRTKQFSAAGAPALRIVAYSRDQCGMDLAPPTSGTDPPATTAVTTTTTG